MVQLFRSVLLTGLVLWLVGCKSTPHKSPATSKGTPFLQAFLVNGIVREVKPDEQTVVIQHEDIPGYMGAMTMPFAVKKSEELQGLKPGDKVSFKMIVTAKDGWLEHIRVIEPAPVSNAPKNILPSDAPVRVVRDVETLNVGDALPDYVFTNELGQAVNFGSYKGQVLAITFIFTRCPYPTFCPLMSGNFAEVQDKLKVKPAALKDWHLFTLSFDPEYDTPDKLKGYAERYSYDPERWSFLTGTILDITAFTEQCGVQFWRQNPSEPINHNLRTLVIDPQGRVFKIFPENKWTSAELVAEMVKAAAPK